MEINKLMFALSIRTTTTTNEWSHHHHWQWHRIIIDISNVQLQLRKKLLICQCTFAFEFVHLAWMEFVCKICLFVPIKWEWRTCRFNNVAKSGIIVNPATIVCFHVNLNFFLLFIRRTRIERVKNTEWKNAALRPECY